MATTEYTSWSTWHTPSGGSARRYRGWVAYSIPTNNDTTYTIRATSGIEQNLAMSVSYTDTQSMTDKSNVTGTTTFTYSSGDTKHTCVVATDYAFTKGHTTATKKLKIAVHATNAAADSGWNTTTLTKEISFTIPVKSNYAVSYYANGGSGSISSQTKWYNESLTLESSGFTRANYTLKGWNTSADGTGTDYALGATYTGNAALTLYAVWELNAVVTKTKVSGAWKSGFLYAKISGVWKIPHTGYVKVSGVWKQIKP